MNIQMAMDMSVNHRLPRAPLRKSGITLCNERDSECAAGLQGTGLGVNSSMQTSRSQ